MNKYLDSINRHLLPIKNIINKYTGVLLLLFFAILAGYLAMRIGYLSGLEPSANQIEQKISEVKQSQIDSESLKKLEELEGRNISIEALFDNGRTNPFEN